MFRRLLLAATTIAVPLAGQTTAPRLTLTEALRRADAHAYANRTAGAAADAQRAQALGAWKGVLPGLRAEAGAMRTTDPMNAFGFLLKQRGVSMASFSPATLNDPAAITNYSSGLVLEQPLVNPDAWMGFRAAQSAASAAASSARWTSTGVRNDVVQAFYGAVLATEMAHTMAAAERSAREHVRSAELATANGFVTRSDALLARVRAGDVTAQRLEAESRARLARQQLALLLGVPNDTAFALPDSLPAPAVVEARIVQPGTPGARDDVQAAEQARKAAGLDVRRAEGSWLPRVNGFARYDWNSPARIAAGPKSWTVGAMASWSLFGGGAELADVRGASARLRGAQAQAEAATASAALERRSADEAIAVALARAAIADTAVTQSAEALRIVRKKYDGGLATVSELLDASAADTQSRLMRSDARFRYLVAAAARLRAWGADPAVLGALDSDLR
ncbi:MAG: TolC family protein [Gemmatimonadaceae bacterium]